MCAVLVFGAEGSSHGELEVPAYVAVKHACFLWRDTPYAVLPAHNRVVSLSTNLPVDMRDTDIS